MYKLKGDNMDKTKFLEVEGFAGGGEAPEEVKKETKKKKEVVEEVVEE